MESYLGIVLESSGLEAKDFALALEAVPGKDHTKGTGSVEVRLRNPHVVGALALGTRHGVGVLPRME